MGIAFIAIGGVGLVLLLISFLVDEALGELFNVFDSDLFSSTAIGGFLTTFGFAGVLALSVGLGALIATVAAVMAGGVVAAGVVWATRALLRSSDEGAPRSADLVGVRGTVVTDIPENGLGQVSLVVAGHPRRVSARRAASASLPDPGQAVYGPVAGATLPAGTPVVVTGVLSATAVEVVRAA